MEVSAKYMNLAYWWSCIGRVYGAYLPSVVFPFPQVLHPLAWYLQGALS